jgi:hypothetical protein
MTKKQAEKIAKINIYSFFYLADGFDAENLSYEDNIKVRNAIRELCEKELNKLNSGTFVTAEECVDKVLNNYVEMPVLDGFYGCHYCVFFKDKICTIEKETNMKLGDCSSKFRKDKKDVYFVKG